MDLEVEMLGRFDGFPMWNDARRKLKEQFMSKVAAALLTHVDFPHGRSASRDIQNVSPRKEDVDKLVHLFALAPIRGRLVSPKNTVLGLGCPRESKRTRSNVPEKENSKADKSHPLRPLRTPESLVVDEVRSRNLRQRGSPKSHISEKEQDLAPNVIEMNETLNCGKYLTTTNEEEAERENGETLRRFRQISRLSPVVHTSEGTTCLAGTREAYREAGSGEKRCVISHPGGFLSVENNRRSTLMTLQFPLNGSTTKFELSTTKRKTAAEGITRRR
ncbi:hypothetical protein WN51_02906 [Melipona quadrifasciata]|uniref:Uncharacterized protein n=1 Tax=Melipona quadrifasciata TaxID=166423 RepID=A0A0M9A8Y3_9HYME|nr:hypothetical protein WN51_02906 [Melipona quadrifasciata]